jgi:hypothetical protein
MFTVAAPPPEPAIEVISSPPPPPPPRPAPQPPQYDDYDDEEEVRPRRRKKRRKSGSNKGLIIGLSVGGGVLALLVIGLVLWLVLRGSGAASNEKLIVGRWQVIEDRNNQLKGLNVMLEFKADGNLVMDAGIMKMNARYRFINRDTIEITDAGRPPDTSQVSISGDQLTITERGGVMRFKRIN